MVKIKDKSVDVLTGVILNLGSIKKNKLSALRKLRNQQFKGQFKISVSKTPKTKFATVKYKAIRKSR